MNKHLYRIIFNRKRGQLMAVAESATADGKAARASRRPAGGARGQLAALRPLAFSTMVMLGLVTLLVPEADAQIVAYRNAPASQQATVLNAGNGVPLVNIQTPSAAGVSHNAYGQFDVRQPGAILNNARINTQTQLGGWVQGNPWLATGTARVILNEVVSSSPSSLNGYVEVAGSSAQVVIANPAGVTCDGCGFVNASRATLTTGTPLLNGGNLDGYRVEGGTVTVQGAGMGSSGAAQTDLIARAVKINAGLWARDLRVTTGTNRVDAENAQATSIAARDAAPAPGFALDVAQLGGMYAGKITLVGTEAGVGVRNAGQIGASAGDVVLTVDGRLINSGGINSSGQTRIESVAGIDNSGTIYAGSALALSAHDDIDNRGMIAAQGNATLTATDAAGRIANHDGATIAAGVAADGTLGTTGKLELTAAQVSTHGQTLAAGDQNLTARELDIADSRISATNVRLTANTGDIDARRAQITASSALAVHAARDVVHDQAHSQAEQLDIAARHLINTDGTFTQTGSDETVVALTGKLDNRSGRLLINSHAFTVTAANVDNTGGSISANGDVALTTGDLVNHGGLIEATGATAQLTLSAARQIDNAAHGELYAATDLTLTAGSVSNTQGRISAGETLEVASAGNIDNSHGEIVANQSVYATATEFDNMQGTLGSALGNIMVSASGARFANQSGYVGAAGDIVLTARGMDNSDGTITGNQVVLETQAQATSNDRGTIIAADSLDLQSGALANNRGLIQAGGAMTIDTHGQLLRNGGSAADTGIVGFGSVTLATGEIDNQGGRIGSRTQLQLTATEVTNTTGKLLAEGSIGINGQRVDNGGGQIQALGDINIGLDGALNKLTNSAGLIRSGQAVNLTAVHIDNSATQGSAQGIEGRLVTLAAHRIDNVSGALRAGTALATISDGQIDNTGGLISSTGALQVSDPGTTGRTLAIANTSGVLIADQSLGIDSASLTGNGKLLSGQDIELTLTAAMAHDGEIIANRNIHLTANGGLINGGRIQAGNTLGLQAPEIDNRASGEIAATRLQLAPTDRLTLSNRGLIDGVDTFITAGTLANLGTGRIYGDHLAIAATNLSNAAEAVAGITSAPVIAARNRLDLGAATISNAEHGLLFSVGDMAIGGALDADHRASGQANAVGNASATIEALGDLALSAHQISNTNEHFGTTVFATGSESVTEYQGSGAATRYLAGTPDVYIYNDESDHLHTPEGNYSSWLAYRYTRTTTETQLTASDPGRILAAGSIGLAADTLLNDNSQIVAGGTLAGTFATLDNHETTGERTFTDAGSATSYWRDHEKGRDRTGSSTSAYAPPDSIQTISLGVASYAGATTPAGSGISVAALTFTPVAATAAGGGATMATIGTGQMRATLTQVPALSGLIAVTVTPDSRLPDSTLFRPTPDRSAHYLIETDPRFANYHAWLSSDYLLQQLGIDPVNDQKRLGDGFYEQRLLREQVARLTGRRFLDGYASDEAQYQALMDAGVTVARAWNLIPGVALSASQMAQLTTDIVWLVEQTVTLADGRTQKALVPQVYARVQPGDLATSGSLIAANTIDLKLTGDLTNAGSIAGRELVVLTAENVQNLGGRISGQQVGLNARNDLANIGGSIEATDTLIAAAGHDLTVASTTRSQANINGSRTHIDRMAGLYVTGENGTLVASAGNDLTLLAAAVVNSNPTTTTGSTLIQAGHDLTLGTVEEAASNRLVWDGKNHRDDQSRIQTGTTIQTAGDLALSAGHDLTATAANVTSEQGALTALAGNDLLLTAGQASQQVDEAHQHKENGFLSSKTRTSRDTLDETLALASTFSGNTTALTAGNDLKLHGSNAVASGDTTLSAGRDLSVESATETRNESHFRKTTQSGLFSSGGVGFTIGSRMQSTDQQSEGNTAAGSTVGSTDSNVRLTAGQAYRQVGSDVIAPRGDIDIAAQSVAITEAREASRTSVETKTKQSGLTIAITSPVISAVQTVRQMSEAVSDTKDGRMQALAAANIGLSAYSTYDGIDKGQGTTMFGKDHQMPIRNEQGKVVDSRDATVGERVGGVNVSISLGASSSSSKTIQTSNIASGSTVVAGGDLEITATGARADSDLIVQGSDLSAAHNVTLTADDQIQLLAAANAADQHSTNKNSSASVGVSFGTNGLMFNVGASGGRGKADGADLAWTNAHVIAGDTLTLASGSDTILKGAVAQGEKVVARVGGELNIESLQDQSSYDSKQKSAGFSLSVGAGAVSGSLSLSQSKVNSDYASVGEQSGIKAGDKGFQVAVIGNTDLKGGIIASSQAALDNGQNRFATSGTLTTEDIQNHAEYEAKSTSINLGSSMSFDGALKPGGTGAGFGQDDGNADSTTRAGITGVAGNAAIRTGNAETGIARIFDAEKVQKDIEAQTRITQTFNQLAPEIAEDYASNKATALKKQAEAESDPSEKAALLDEGKKWSPNGSYNIAMNIIIGAAGGNLNSAATKETLSWAANEMRQAMIEDSKKFKGICDTQRNCVSNFSGESVGVNGDGMKIAGGRIILANWCSENRCETDPTTASGYKENSDGTVVFDPKDSQGNSITLSEFVDQHPSWRSPLGGHQGGEGQMELLGFQFNYGSGSFWDQLAEAYSGTHDTLNSLIWYDELGNGKNLDGTIIGNIGNAANTTNVVVATPFALGVLLPPNVWNAVVSAIGLTK